MDAGTCHILHVDMDAFYAAVEQLDHPELRGKPVIVGSPPNQRGVVSTASYEAREYGVHSALPSRTAYRLCPHGIFLPVRMERYVAVSKQIMSIFRRFTPMVEKVSVDEAFLDIADVPGSGNPVGIGRALKQTIRDETGLTASVGIAPNKFLAKLASDLEKPDGLTVVPTDPRAIERFLAPLPVGKIWGVGKVTGTVFTRAGIRTIGQIQAMSVLELEKIVGLHSALHIHRLAFGRDDRTVQTEHEEKSISAEETFPMDCDDPVVLRRTLIELTERVGRRLRRSRKLAGTGQLKLRFEDFTTITRQQPLRPPTSSDRALLVAALTLFRRERVRRPIRLIGFGVHKLTDLDMSGSERQPLLFDDVGELLTADEKREARLDAAVDMLREQYGHRILRRGVGE